MISRLLVSTLLLILVYSAVYAAAAPMPTMQVPMHPVQLLAYFHGETQNVGDGTISSWVYVDANNRPLSLGVTFTETMLQNLPKESSEYLLRLPEYVPHLPFDHFTIDWEPQGHFPEQFYGLPHFDFHFYLISQKRRGSITGTGPDEARIHKLLPEKYVPKGYVPAKPGVAYMGLHWVRLDFPEFNGRPFTESLIYGSYDGKLAFIEPMITRAFLLSHTDVSTPMYQSPAVQLSGYYPTRYSIKYDAERHLYTVALDGLTYRKAD